MCFFGNFKKYQQMEHPLLINGKTVSVSMGLKMSERKIEQQKAFVNAK